MIADDNYSWPEMDYLENLLRYRLNRLSNHSEDELPPELPPVDQWRLPWEDFIKQHELYHDEIVLLLIAMTPHIQPDLFDRVIQEKVPDPGDLPAVGGVRGKNTRYLLPTGETGLFLLGGNDFASRLRVQKIFSADNVLTEKKILWLEDVPLGEPIMNGRMVISQDYVTQLMYGFQVSPPFSISFPAKKIAPVKGAAPLSFNDLVIPEDLKIQIDELKHWLEYNDDLIHQFGMKEKIKPGYRTLFYGPPGTGKTFTARILGDELGKEVYRIDLSMVVSKYIGETEKNLEVLFARAEDKGWILFFDEADALFGKRTSVRDAHDKYANQEVSYLLQRIEDYNGLVILATNMKNNIDDAFLRRFNAVLKFPFPDATQRAEIWRKAFPPGTVFRESPSDSNPVNGKCAPTINLPESVKKYEMAGGSIMNVASYAGIAAVRHFRSQSEQRPPDETDSSANEDRPYPGNSKPVLTVFLSDILAGIRREMIKEGKPFAM